MTDIQSRAKTTPFSVVRAGKQSSMPKGFDYELLWAKDTQVLWIQTPSAKIPIGGVVSIVRACNQDELPCNAADYELIWSKDTKILWIKTPEGNFPIGGPGYMPCEGQNQNCGSGLSQFIECLCQAIVGSGSGGGTDEKVKAHSGDPTAGYLVDKVDNETIVVDTQTNKLKVVATGLPGTDTKVKADENDPNAGYLSAKVDDTTIKVNTDQHKIYVVDDSNIQKVRWLEDGSEKGVRSAANFKSTDTVSVSVTDDNVRNAVSIELSTPDDKSNQRVKVLVDGTEVGTRSAINFVSSGNVTITGADSDTDNRVNITISGIGGGSGGTIDVYKDYYRSGSASAINFVQSDSVVFNAFAPVNGMIDIQAYVNLQNVPDQKVKADADDPVSGYLSDKVDNTTITVDTDTHKLVAAGKVKVDDDDTPGYLSDKIDNDTIIIDSNTGKLKANVSGGSGDGKVKVVQNDTPGYLGGKVDGRTIRWDFIDNEQPEQGRYAILATPKYEIGYPGEVLGAYGKSLRFMETDTIGWNSNDVGLSDYFNTLVNVVKVFANVKPNSTHQNIRLRVSDDGSYLTLGHITLVSDDGITLELEQTNVDINDAYPFPTNVFGKLTIGLKIDSDTLAFDDEGRLTVIATGLPGTDTKVKADENDPQAGYLSDKVDNETITVDTDTHKLKAIASYKVKATADDDNPGYLGQKIDGSTIVVNHNNQLEAKGKVRTYEHDTNPGYLADKIDNDTIEVEPTTYKLRSAGKVKLDGMDESPGYLEDKIDNQTIVVDQQTKRLKAEQKITVNGFTGKSLNIIAGDGISITVSTDSDGNISVVISAIQQSNSDNNPSDGDDNNPSDDPPSDGSPDPPDEPPDDPPSNGSSNPPDEPPNEPPYDGSPDLPDDPPDDGSEPPDTW